MLHFCHPDYNGNGRKCDEKGNNRSNKEVIHAVGVSSKYGYKAKDIKYKMKVYIYVQKEPGLSESE
jgi:hypothetical protein